MLSSPSPYHHPPAPAIEEGSQFQIPSMTQHPSGASLPTLPSTCISDAVRRDLKLHVQGLRSRMMSHSRLHYETQRLGFSPKNGLIALI